MRVGTVASVDVVDAIPVALWALVLMLLLNLSVLTVQIRVGTILVKDFEFDSAI